ncbi:MAG: mannosyltransferase family protein [Chloroflexota bacterium]
MNIVIEVFLKRVWWQQVVLVQLIALVGIQFAGTIGTKYLVPRFGWGESHNVTAGGGSDDTLEGRFARWDSNYYLRIAQRGYTSEGGDVVFFPLYPLLISLLHNALGLSLLWSGWIVAVTCYFGAGLLLYQLIRTDHSAELALWGVVWLSIFPTAFFFTSLYTESLFILTSIAALYFAGRGQFTLSGLAIAFAGATRPTAFLLAIPFFVEVWQFRRLGQIRSADALLGTLIAPAGVMAFYLHLVATVGDGNIIGLYSSTALVLFERNLALPWETFSDALKAAVFAKGFTQVIARHDLAFALTGMASAVFGLFHLRQSMALYFLAGMIFLFSNHGPAGLPFLSIPRYVAALFPLYLVLAIVTTKMPKQLRWLPVLVSVCFLGILSAWFATGRWVA